METEFFLSTVPRYIWQKKSKWALLDVISVSCAQTIYETGVSGVHKFEDRNACLSHLCATKVQFNVWMLTLKASICEARIYKVFRESELKA